MSSEAELSGLHSVKSTRRLEQIAGLRDRAIGGQVDLPQLVACDIKGKKTWPPVPPHIPRAGERGWRIEEWWTGKTQ